MNRRGGRADERHVVGGARLCEVLVLGQEAVAGVNRLRTAVLGDVQDLVAQQVAFRGGSRAQAEGFVGLRPKPHRSAPDRRARRATATPTRMVWGESGRGSRGSTTYHRHVLRRSIGVTVKRDGFHAHLACRLHDTARDLATVGDHDLVKHEACGNGAREHCGVTTGGRDNRRRRWRHPPSLAKQRTASREAVVARTAQRKQAQMA